MTPTSGAGGRSRSSHRRLNVLHVSAEADGGLSAIALGYVRDQVERGWHVTVACPTEGPLGYQSRIAGARTRWWAVGPARPYRGILTGSLTVAEIRALGEVVEAANPDLVHLHGTRAGIAGRLVLRNRVPTLVQPHGFTFRAAGRGVRATSWRWERRADRWTTELLALSTDELRAAGDHGLTGASTVLANGVDLERFPAQGDAERRTARVALGLHEAPTVLCVGRLRAQKGQQDLLEAWPDVRRQVPDAELLLVGEGPAREALVRQARKLSGVSLPGWRGDMLSWYAAADVVVAPSRFEGSSLVPLEAMATSRSVVATEVGGIADHLPPEAGALVEPRNREALVDALVRRLRDPGLVEDEGWNGRLRVEQYHDPRKVAQDLARVYLRLVASRR